MPKPNESHDPHNPSSARVRALAGPVRGLGRDLDDAEISGLLGRLRVLLPEVQRQSDQEEGSKSRPESISDLLLAYEGERHGELVDTEGFFDIGTFGEYAAKTIGVAWPSWAKVTADITWSEIEETNEDAWEELAKDTAWVPVSGESADYFDQDDEASRWTGPIIAMRPPINQSERATCSWHEMRTAWLERTHGDLNSDALAFLDYYTLEEIHDDPSVVELALATHPNA